MSDTKGTVAGLPDHAEGGLEAPVIYFEGVPTFGVGPGIGKIVLEMVINEPSAQGTVPTSRRRIVAHLRGPLAAFDALRGAINEMEAMLTPKSDQKPN